MSEEKQDKRSMGNPLSGAASIALGTALGVTIGAAIREHDIHDEAVTFLAGGAITGAIAGTIGLCALAKTNKDSGTCWRLAMGLLDASLSLAAVLTAPLMGEKCLGYGTDYSDMVVDDLVGSATLVAGALAVTAVAATAVCCCSGASGFFSRKAPASTVPAREGELDHPAMNNV